MMVPIVSQKSTRSRWPINCIYQSSPHWSFNLYPIAYQLLCLTEPFGLPTCQPFNWLLYWSTTQLNVSKSKVVLNQHNQWFQHLFPRMVRECKMFPLNYTKPWFILSLGPLRITSRKIYWVTAWSWLFSELQTWP